MKKIGLCFLILLVFVGISCQKTGSYKDKLNVKYQDRDPKSLEIKRYDQALFGLDTADLLNGLKSIQPEYQPFLRGDLNNPQALAYMKRFVTDTFCIRINKMVQDEFADVSQLTKDIQSVYQRLNYYYPNITLPKTYFYVSGVDYETPPVMVSNDGILISLDYYLGNQSGIYDYIGMPRFRSARTWSNYITKDLSSSLFFFYLYKSRIQKDVLTEMICTGKQNFFNEAMNPSLPDSVLLGFSARQMQWAADHEGDIWASIVGNDLLYAKGFDAYQKFFGDGPFTQAFSNEAPARIGEFIGLQIVRSYMENNDVTLQELMDNVDTQEIFQNSQYKPRK